MKDSECEAIITNIAISSIRAKSGPLPDTPGNPARTQIRAMPRVLKVCMGATVKRQGPLTARSKLPNMNHSHLARDESCQASILCNAQPGPRSTDRLPDRQKFTVDREMKRNFHRRVYRKQVRTVVWKVFRLLIFNLAGMGAWPTSS